MIFMVFLVESCTVKMENERQGFRYGTLEMTVGKLKKEIPYPACMLSTNAGTVPNLTNETLSYISEALLPKTYQVPVPSIIDHAGTFSAYSGSSHELMRLPSPSVLYVSTQDQLPRTRNIPNVNQNSAKAISIWGNSGRVALTAEKHIELVTSLAPDIFEVLADGDTTADNVSKKRVSKSFANSLKFFEESLKLLKENDRLTNSSFIIPLQGGNSIDLRKKYVSEILSKLKENSAMEKCTGFLVDGITHTKELTSDIVEHIKASLEGLPQDKLRFIPGPRSPSDIFKLFECGIDVFDTSYPINAAQKNKAIIFPIKNHKNDTKDGTNDQECDTMSTWMLDMSNTDLKDTFEPILHGCECYTCGRHTRAYIHHLVSVRELLAPILLTLHNLHHYLLFFDLLRKSVKNGNLAYLKFKANVLGMDT